MNHGKHEKHGSEQREPLLYENETFRIQGAIFEVSRHMGAGFLEAVYHECLAREFATQAIPFVSCRPLQLAYKGEPLKQTYSPDFVCFDKVIVELKAVRDFAPEHQAQVLNYLRASGLRVGLLVNFGCAPKARVIRLAL
jgi:GxxExxY protein